MPPDRSTAAALVRLSLGLVYFHFGLLKFFPDLSPAELIAGESVARSVHYWLDGRTVMLPLAVAECTIGLGLLFRVFPRVVLGLFLVHMAGTFLPLVVLPEWTFRIAPLAPTLEGQYILKNLVFLAAGWLVLAPAAAAASSRPPLWGRIGKPFIGITQRNSGAAP